MRLLIAIAIFAVTSTFGTQGWASADLSDSTFDLANYTVTTFATRQTISVSTNLTGGNPGSALQINIDESPQLQSQSEIYIVGKHLTYDPGSSGSITSLSFSADKYMTSNFWYSVGPVSLLLVQNGNYYYSSSAPLPTVGGVYQTAFATNLSADSFSRITDLTNGVVDASQHPSFQSGVMNFGLLTGWFAHGVAHIPYQIVQRFDNLDISISSVPEPGTLEMSVLGLFAVMAWKRAGRRVGVRAPRESGKPIHKIALPPSMSALALILLISLAGCGGDDGGSASTPPSAQALVLTGTAATGAVIAGQAVDAKCATGAASAVTQADGNYSLSIAGGVWPCIARVTTSTGLVLHTPIAGSGTSATANLTPATQLIVARLVGTDPAAYFAAFDASTAAAITASGLATAQAQVISVLKAAGVDFSAAGDLVSGAFAVASAYDTELDALAAALAQSATTLDTLTTDFVNMAGSSVPSVPAEFLLQPAASTCAALRSGSYRIVTPTSGATLADQYGVAVVDAATLAIQRADGSTGTLVANGSCRFTDQGGSYSADIVVSQAGFWVARFTRDNGLSYHDFFGFPAQTHALTELAGAWSVMGMTAASTGYTGTAGSVSFDGAGTLTAASTCQNDSTWAVDVCNDLSATDIAAAPPLTANADGGFDEVDAATGVATSRVFAFTAGSGDTVLASVANDGSYFFYAPLKDVALPNVGLAATNWDLDVTPQLASSQSTYEKYSIVTSTDPATDSYARTAKTIGGTDDHTETLFANNPRSGYVHRPAGTATAIDGSTVKINEYTALRMPGTGVGPLLLLLTNGGKLFELSVTEP